MARCINEVEDVFLSMQLIIHLDGVALNRDALLAFKIHIVEHLIHHLPFADGVGALEQAVGQRAFSVINVSNDAEVPDLLHEGAKVLYRGQIS